MGSPYRVNRVRESLLRELGHIIGQLKDPRIGMVNVIDVKISRDLRYAKLYVSVLGTDAEREETMVALQSAEGHLRREVAQRLSLRFAPEIGVVYDNSGERAAHLSGLLQTLGRDEDGGR